MKYTLPVLVLLMMPFFGAQPASSPMLFLKWLLSLSITGWPLIITVLEPSVVSSDSPVFG